MTPLQCNKIKIAFQVAENVEPVSTFGNAARQVATFDTPSCNLSHNIYKIISQSESRIAYEQNEFLTIKINGVIAVANQIALSSDMHVTATCNIYF